MTASTVTYKVDHRWRTPNSNPNTFAGCKAPSWNSICATPAILGAATTTGDLLSPSNKEDSPLADQGLNDLLQLPGTPAAAAAESGPILVQLTMNIKEPSELDPSPQIRNTSEQQSSPKPAYLPHVPFQHHPDSFPFSPPSSQQQQQLPHLSPNFPYHYGPNTSSPSGPLYSSRGGYQQQYSYAHSHQPGHYAPSSSTLGYFPSHDRSQGNLAPQLPYGTLPATAQSPQPNPYSQRPSPDPFDPTYVQYSHPQPSYVPPSSDYSVQEGMLHASSSQSSNVQSMTSQSPSENVYQATQFSPITGFGYPQHAFPPSGGQMYQPSYGGQYPIQAYYRRSPQEDSGGTWWYLPQGITSPNSPYSPTQSGGLANPYSLDYQAQKWTENDPSSRAPGSQAGYPGANQSRHRVSPSKQGHASAAANMQLGVSRLSVSSPGPLQAVKAPDIPRSVSAPRKPYHPNPPVNRSEWVMWVGNVPSDATHNELWIFFNKPISKEEGDTEHLPSELLSPVVSEFPKGGVASVFLISRSNCAFVNFDTEAHLLAAIEYFNGKSLRPHDPRCMNMVCRIRKADDDLKAGVGGQRGMGMHTGWIKEKKARAKAAEVRASAEGQPLAHQPNLSQSSASETSVPEAKQSSSSSGSYASTNSSFLIRHFPVRYFILKSLNEADLNLSVERGVWATQQHNEIILDQAYHTSGDVYLIFSANKSGEFFGYARMSGGIKRGDKQVSWTSREDSGGEMPHVTRTSQPPELPVVEEPPDEEGEPPAPEMLIPDMPQNPLLSPSEHRMAVDSPGMLTEQEEKRLRDEFRASEVPPPGAEAGEHTDDPSPAASPSPVSPPHSHSAPAEDLKGHGKLSHNVSHREHGTSDQPSHSMQQVIAAMSPTPTPANKSLTEPTVLDTLPPDSKAVITQELMGGSAREPVDDGDGVLRKDTLPSEEEKRKTSDSLTKEHPEMAEELDLDPKSRTQKDNWGDPFAIEWIRTEKLSFQRTKHLRNPWNHDREVKVSRDGTELEPTAGAALLAEWDKIPKTAIQTNSNIHEAAKNQ